MVTINIQILDDLLVIKILFMCILTHMFMCILTHKYTIVQNQKNKNIIYGKILHTNR